MVWRVSLFPFQLLHILFVLLLEEARASCQIEGTSCHCYEEPTPQEDSLSNILAYCCQSDIFQVHINGSRLSGVSPFYQKPCHNLIDFRIQQTSYTSLTPDGLAFNGLPNLEFLYITGDPTLSMLSKGAFSGLEASLRYLNLSNNALSSLIGYEFNGFANPNSKLEEVDLSENQLSSLRPGGFKHFKSIRSLSLAGNSISELRSDVFNGLEQLEELDLRRNPINVIIGGTFQQLSKLRTLLISGLHSIPSSLTTLTPGMLYGLQSLRQLEISNLGITSVSADAFIELRNLQELDLSGNKLANVPHTAFKRMMLAHRGGRFQRLNLSRNRITCLSAGVFLEFPQLKHLDLSGNFLTVISDQAFLGIKHLREISLLENPLLVIIPGAFDAFAGVDENGMRDAIKILHRHRVTGESFPKKTVVRIPNDDNIVGINKLRLRTVYGRQNDIDRDTIAPFIDISCPSLPLPNRASLKRTDISVEAVAAADESPKKGLSGFLTQNKIFLTIIIACVVVTLVVTSATILSCQTCRKRRRGRAKMAVSSSTVGSPLNSKGGKSHYSSLSKQNAFSYNSLEVGSTGLSGQLSAVGEKMSTSELLFNLSQQLEPPPYPHNLQMMEEHRLQAAVTSVRVPGLFNSYITTGESPHLHSGQSSPSNLGSSPRFSSSTSSVQHRRHLVMTSSAIDREKRRPLLGSASPLHESGIVSDNASSSLITSMGVV